MLIIPVTWVTETKFKATLGNLKPCLKIKNANRAKDILFGCTVSNCLECRSSHVQSWDGGREKRARVTELTQQQKELS